MSNIDITDLQNEVMDKWECDGVVYTTFETASTDPSLSLQFLTPNAELVLGSIEQMVDQLGFDSVSQYISSKQGAI